MWFALRIKKIEVPASSLTDLENIAEKQTILPAEGEKTAPSNRATFNLHNKNLDGFLFLSKDSKVARLLALTFGRERKGEWIGRESRVKDRAKWRKSRGEGRVEREERGGWSKENRE